MNKNYPVENMMNKNNSSNSNINTQRILIVVVIVLALAVSACSRITGNNQDTGRLPENQEESGVELGLNEIYDRVRNGARLILAYDAQSNSFQGTVENTTEKILKQVRVEIHISNGVELGPTTPMDLHPGESINVNLTATTDGFDGWTAHPEVGESTNGEHGSDSGEHGGEGEGEHGEESESEHEGGGSN
jgi:hypothetical protein